MPQSFTKYEIDHHELKFIVGLIALSLANLAAFFSHLRRQVLAKDRKPSLEGLDPLGLLIGHGATLAHVGPPLATAQLPPNP